MPQPCVPPPSSPPLLRRTTRRPQTSRPQPDAVTQDWSFDFEYTQPDTIAIEGADGTVQWYWYMTYKVTNYEADELFFDPRIVIQSDNGEIVTRQPRRRYDRL